ncbi:MAG TPA: ribbon-helix-helix protein, CopG family [Candidatus Bathyarchaeota archaeon]|nr:ribbon-helix-helix protein, CopG family [Candidatus Bathyarchaeota archaeon]
MNSGERLKIVSIRLPEVYIELIDELIRLGIYPSRSEIIRVALREFLSKEINTHGNVMRILREKWI